MKFSSEADDERVNDKMITTILRQFLLFPATTKTVDPPSEEQSLALQIIPYGIFNSCASYFNVLANYT